MTEEQRIEHVLKTGPAKPQRAEDRSPVWLRLVKSLRIAVKPGTTLRRPIKQIVIKGGVDF